MIRDVRVHRADDADVVDALADLGEDLADFDAGLAVLLELERRLEEPAGLAFGLEARRRAASRRGTSRVRAWDRTYRPAIGPPFMNRWMTCLAFGGKCGTFGASGFELTASARA